MDNITISSMQTPQENVFSTGRMHADSINDRYSADMGAAFDEIVCRILPNSKDLAVYFAGAAYQIVDNYYKNKENHISTIESCVFGINILSKNKQIAETEKLNSLGIANKILNDYTGFLEDIAKAGSKRVAGYIDEVKKMDFSQESKLSEDYENIEMYIADAKSDLEMLKNEIVWLYLGKEGENSAKLDYTPVLKTSFMERGLLTIRSRINRNVESKKLYRYASEFIENEIFKYKEQPQNEGLFADEYTGRGIRFFG